MHDAVTGVIQAPAKGVNQKKFLANNQTVTEYSAAYNIVKAAQFRLTEQDTKQRKAVIRITLTGKARIRVTGEDGIEYLSKEYSNKADNTYSITADLTTAPNQIYTVTLELAGTTGSVFQSVNNIFEVSWGNLASNMGVLYSLIKDLQEDARTVRISWVGNGVLFDVSTDNGKTWETVENGEVTQLKNPGRKIVVKALLPVDPSTVLNNYVLEINPAGYSLFTGKVLEESIGLVYFGGRWYDPEVGRFVSPDPSEDGRNWYVYCRNNPINAVDPDGRITFFLNGIGNNSGVPWYAKKLVNDQRLASVHNFIAIPTFEHSGNIGIDLIHCIGMALRFYQAEADKAYKKVMDKLQWSKYWKGETINFVGYSGGAIISYIIINRLAKDPWYKGEIDTFTNIGNGRWQYYPNRNAKFNYLIYGSKDCLVGGSMAILNDNQEKFIFALRRWDAVSILDNTTHPLNEKEEPDSYWNKSYEDVVEFLIWNRCVK